MADNNNNRDNRNNNNKNNNRMRGILTLVLWAVVLTVAMNYISAYSGNTANKTSSHEIKYSEMVDMVEKDQVKEILFRDSTIYITPVDGYTYTEEVEEGSTAQPKSYTQSKETQLTLFTKQLSDSQLLGEQRQLGLLGQGDPADAVHQAAVRQSAAAPAGRTQCGVHRLL